MSQGIASILCRNLLSQKLDSLMSTCPRVHVSSSVKQVSECRTFTGAVVMSVCTTKTEMCNPISVLASLKKKNKKSRLLFFP